MQNYSVESKSQLAKLLATENLTIQHQKIRTAKFDTLNRVLYCPIWDDMTGDLYDLLLGHEVGHALYTPKEGWHDAVSDKGENYKRFLNVIEDARIEKKIKRKYPGIRKSFINGYSNLLERNFFGIKNQNVNDLAFIDRLNLYTKGGTMLGIAFDEKEQAMLTKVEAVETWNDVLKICDEIFDYSKEEQSKKQIMSPHNDFEDFEDYDAESDDDENYDDYDTEESEDEYDSEKPVKNSSENGDEDDEGLNQNNLLNREKESKKFGEENQEFEPDCVTDEAFRENESKLLDEKCRDFRYMNVPKLVNPKAVYTGYKRVHELMEKFFKDHNVIQYHNGTPENLVKEFKNRNDRYISLLAKEFEMKKSAKSYSKAKISDTGDIDVNKIYKYQIEDNIFRKMTVLPKGKSHGLVLLLDKSGSMRDNMSGSIEQILILTAFCRKVNIPFSVYGFGDCDHIRRIDVTDDVYLKQRGIPAFSRKAGEMDIEGVYLREYLNSNMKTGEYNRCVKNMILLANAYSFNKPKFNIPPSEGLNMTPLIQSIFAIEPAISKFKIKNNLDIVNLIVVHDGDADSCGYHLKYDENRNNISWEGWSHTRENVIVADNSIKFQMKLDPNISYPGEALREASFEWLRKKTGVRIFGFFITSKSRRRLLNDIQQKYKNEKGESVNKGYICNDVRMLAAQVKKEKFLESYNKGYNRFYLLPSGEDLKIENEEIEIDGKFTANKLKNAFMKFNKKRQVNRVLVSKFIAGIAS